MKMTEKKIEKKVYEIEIEKGTKISLTENEVVELIARRILTKNKSAFERLAQ